MLNEIDFDDFDEKPIYIRTDVQSCSILPTKRQGSLLGESTNAGFTEGGVQANSFLQIELNKFASRNNIESGDTNKVDPDSSSSDMSFEEWSPTKNEFSSKSDEQNSFRNRFYSTPRTMSAAFTKVVNNLFENPEGRMTNLQRVSIILFTCFEAYRTIISSYLTVFVPQKCDGYSCTILQNIIPKDNLEVAAISINTFMALYFCVLFTAERIRETTVKNYLVPDKSYPTDKEYLVKMISIMNPHERKQILRLNRIYRMLAQLLLLVFFANASISCIIIQKNYLNNTTVTVFITNTLFMINRIHKALKITSSGEYNIYSAYRSDNLLYNRYRGEIVNDYILPGFEP
jgi:hypothetical protein